MTITLEKLREKTNNFEGQDFWHWFLTSDQISNNTKVNIIDWFMSEFYNNEDIADYMEDLGIIKGE